MSVGFGRYELLRRLGHGGMGEVFLAQRRAGGIAKRLVIKRIHRARASDPRFLAMFKREAQLSMALAHQNIVTVFDFGRVEGDVFLAMEHVEGIDLATALARADDHRVPPLIAAFIAAECCRALDHAHRRNDPDGVPLRVIHRDVSPRNLLVSHAGEVKLVDFGVAAVTGEVAGRVQGTPSYMAPEQARGEPVDARADLYALGLVLWEAVSGGRVRVASDVDALLALAAAGTLPALPADLPPPLREIIGKATTAAAANRFPDARSMLAALDTYILSARAAELSAAPAELLADWLERASPRATGDADELDGPAIAEVQTFIEDGADALGAGTQLSRAVTVDEPSPSAPPPEARRSDVLPVDVLGAGPPAARARRARISLAAGAAAALLVIGWWIARRDGASSPPKPGMAAAEAPPAAIASPPPPPPASTTVSPARPAPAPSTPPPDAAPAVHAPAVAKPGHRRPPAPVTPAASSTSAPANRTVVIGARPWATFRVDDDPTPHQTPDTLQLAPGAHVVHFANPTLAIERDVTIIVSPTSDLRHVENLER